MDFFEEDFWIEDDAEDTPEEALQKIQSVNNAKIILKEMQITRASHFKKDIKKIIKQYIREFFKNKKDYNGNKIKQELLFTNKYIGNILDFSILESTKLVYSVLCQYKKYSLKNKKDDVTNDIKLVNETLKKIYRSKIPQQFAGGFLLMYLEVCEGVNLEI